MRQAFYLVLTGCALRLARLTCLAALPGLARAFASLELQTRTRHFLVSLCKRMVRGPRTRKAKLLHPAKYYRGLTRRAQRAREREIARFGALATDDPRAYVGFATDKGVKTRDSSYTQQWNALFPDAKSLDERAAVTGVPKRFLQESYDRGMAAWRTGHRPGATQQQWGYARVSSLLLCGKTHYSTDSDLVRKAKRVSRRARRWFSGRCPVSPLTQT